MEKRKNGEIELKRKPLEGVFNIIRFNWHFYFFSGLILISLILFKNGLPEQIQPSVFWFSLLALLTTVFSLLISFYVYDLSDLYQLRWLPNSGNKKILNINAGFDETSEIIKKKLPDSELTICDFYDPEKHTEVSIRRARQAYPPPPETIPVTTEGLPFPDYYFDYSLAILSAHEIRDEEEIINFFKELNRVTKSTGQVFVTEHLRDLNNFMAYSIGFFHFHPKSKWLRTFKNANFSVNREVKTTPFITTFILEKNGDTL